MAKSGKTVKLKKRKQVNIGTIIFIFIIIYLSASVIYSYGKEKISIYEVQEENLARDLTVTGVIIREEKLCYSNSAGYVNYYVKEGRRTKKNGTVYSMDANRSVYGLLGAEKEIELTKEDMSEIKRMIAAFLSSYDGEDFRGVYDLKESITVKAGELSDQNLFDNMQSISANTGIDSAIQFVASECAGIVTYASDSLDGLTADAVNSSVFHMEDFASSSLRTAEFLAAGSPIYKIVTSNDWEIMAPITMEQYTSLQDRKRLKFTVEKDSFSFTAPVEFLVKGSDYYMAIHLSQYVSRYLEDRFLTLHINLSEEKGLKIPQSAVLTKEFYVVPPDYFTHGGDSAEIGLTVVTYNSKTGEAEYAFVKADIYYQDDDYAYVDKSLFLAGTTIYCYGTGETMPLAMTGSLEGAYCVNRGYAVFRRIEKLEENESYLIIKRGTSGGLSVYDHIALNAGTVKESSIIY